MSLTSILSAEAIEKAVKDCEAPGSFCCKQFFQLCGLSSKTPREIKEVFQILDEDKSGYIEGSELKYFLQQFIPGARMLTDAESASFISAADDDCDGRIGADDPGPVLRSTAERAQLFKSSVILLNLDSSDPCLNSQ